MEMYRDLSWNPLDKQVACSSTWWRKKVNYSKRSKTFPNRNNNFPKSKAFTLCNTVSHKHDPTVVALILYSRSLHSMHLILLILLILLSAVIILP
mmetsp:Transcript_27437/g.40562  ORF Transcript_27437/g.40562 Transcript_27437/m.40562 type:complete len:95 (+) Transcript_27437:155-439(+)